MIVVSSAPSPLDTIELLYCELSHSTTANGPSCQLRKDDAATLEKEQRRGQEDDSRTRVRERNG